MPFPPGPSQPPLLQTIRWLTRPLAFMQDCRRRYGDAFSVRFLGFQTPMVMLADPEAIRALYRGRENGLPPGRTLTLGPILGDRSLLLLEGEEHLARRRLMLPPFHGERMRAYEAVIAQATEDEVDRWPVDRAFAVHPRMQAITLEVILRAVFGVTDAQRRAELTRRLPLLLGETASPGLQLSFLISRRLGRGDPLAALREAMAPIDALLAEVIADRRADPHAADREDILSLLLSARFEDGSGMGDHELRDQLMTLLLAGHETTATGLAWTFDLLLRNPSALARLKDELDAGEGDGYLRAVVAESLRLRPVVPIAGRRLRAELRSGDLVLEAGTDVTPAIWLVHTRPDLYPEPFAFRPERFLDAPPETYAWLPFGGGVRRCIGAAFAEFEMRIVLAAVLRRCELRAVGAKPERIARRNVTLAPRNGTRVVLRSRSPRPVREPAAA